MLGRPITALHFAPPSYAQPRPPAVLVGAIHGDEPIGVHCLSRLAADLIERPPGRDTWIVPALNLDGLAGGCQNNANDVDLDRNFAAADWRAEHPAGYGPGAEPESEPETRALAALIERISARRLIAVQAPRGIVAWAGSGRELALAMAERNGYPVADHACGPGSLPSRYGRDLGLEVVVLDIPLVDEDQAWQQNRYALRHALDLPL